MDGGPVRRLVPWPEFSAKQPGVVRFVSSLCVFKSPKRALYKLWTFRFEERRAKRGQVLERGWTFQPFKNKTKQKTLNVPFQLQRGGKTDISEAV